MFLGCFYKCDWTFLFCNGIRREDNLQYMLLEPSQFIKNSLSRVFSTSWCYAYCSGWGFQGFGQHLSWPQCVGVFFASPVADVNEIFRSRWSNYFGLIGRCKWETRLMAFAACCQSFLFSGQCLLCCGAGRRGAEPTGATHNCHCPPGKSPGSLSSQNRGFEKQFSKILKTAAVVKPLFSWQVCVQIVRTLRGFAETR